MADPEFKKAVLLLEKSVAIQKYSFFNRRGPHKFESQFNLSATSTMVSGNTIEPYSEKYQKFV